MRFLERFNDLPLGQYRKVVALTYIVMGSFFLILFFIIYIFIQKSQYWYVYEIILLIFLLVLTTVLILLAKKKVNLALDLAVTVPLLIYLVLNFIYLRLGYTWEKILYTNFIYIILELVATSVFCTKRILYFNFFITIISTSLFFNIVYSHILPDEKGELISLFINYFSFMLIFFALIIFSRKNFDVVVETLEKEKQTQEHKTQDLGKLLGQMDQAVDALNLASGQLVELAESLSSKVSEQAASTEEISSSTEEMSVSLENTSEFLRFTHESAERADAELKQGTSNLEKVFEILREIAQKIGFITDIAEKTDILAINAAIEAAHAGESGRGFAVVAQEIRKLADVSKGFAEEITGLVNENLELSEDLDKRFRNIVEQISLITDKVGNIRSTTDELLQTINVINASASQLSQAAEENASVAEKLVIHSNNLQMLGELLKGNKM